MAYELELVNQITNKIFTIRGQRVMIDRDLAELYGVKTMVLNQAVKRNIERFPLDFMFRLTKDELKELITNCDRLEKLKHSPTTPLVFTEHGVAMLSSVLNSKKAIEINIQIVRAFIQLRQYAIAQTSRTKEIEELRKMLMLHIENCDNKFSEHQKHIAAIVTALNNLIEQPREHKKIGFSVDE